MHVPPVIRIRSLFAAAVVLACSATAARAHFILDDPNGGEALEVGSVHTITWHIVNAHTPQNWGLWYSTESSSGPWSVIAFGLPPGSGEAGSIHTYDWTVPDDLDDTVWVLAWMNNSGYKDDYTDTNDAPFSIVLPVCSEDLDGDDTVGAFDLAQLLGSWGPSESCPPFDAADFNEDCGVDAFDLAVLLGAWGPCP